MKPQARRSLTTFLALAILLLWTGCDQQPLTDADEHEQLEAPSSNVLLSRDSAPIPGQYIVVFNDRVSDAPGLARQLTAAQDGELRFTYEHVLKGFAAQLSETAARALERNPNVAYVEADQTVHLVSTEQQEDATWGLDRIDQRDADLDDLYHYSATGQGVTAYILDTGIRYTHQDFGGRAAFGFDAIGDGQEGEDCNGHGTHVAGTVGGVEWGVAKDVALVAVRVLDCGGSGSTSGVIAGIDWVTANATAPAVANMSLGGGTSDALDDAVRNSIDAGISYAVAAGNGNFIGIHQDACNTSPARVEEAMTISATDDADTKASWANYGDCVDWFAPGVSITSAWIGGDDDTNTIGGTSMAAPHAAGVAALYLEDAPSANPQEVYDAIYEATTKDMVSSSRTDNNHLLYSLLESGDDGDDPDPNEPPTADFTWSADGLTVQFTDQSSDADGDVVAWDWDFGDGATSTTQHPEHTYASEGTYTVTLTVTDDDEATDSASQDVSVSEGDDSGTSDPAIDQLSVSTRTSGPWLRATVSWAVSDEDGDLAQVTTELLDGNSVVDSQTSSVSGASASGEHEVRTRGSADAVRLTVVDAAGNETTQTQDL